MIEEIRKQLEEAKANAVVLKKEAERNKLFVKYNAKLIKDLTDQLEALKAISDGYKENKPALDNSELQPGD